MKPKTKKENLRLFNPISVNNLAIEFNQRSEINFFRRKRSRKTFKIDVGEICKRLDRQFFRYSRDVEYDLMVSAIKRFNTFYSRDIWVRRETEILDKLNLFQFKFKTEDNKPFWNNSLFIRISNNLRRQIDRPIRKPKQFKLFRLAKNLSKPIRLEKRKSDAWGYSISRITNGLNRRANDFEIGMVIYGKFHQKRFCFLNSGYPFDKLYC